MFGNLIESGSHRRDIKRRSSFFFGAMFLYAVLLAAAGVASIYAYDARLRDAQDLTLVSMMRFAPVAAAEELPRREPPPAAAASVARNEATLRTKIVVNAPVVPSRTVSDDNTPEVSPKQFVVISTVNRDPVGAGIPLDTTGTGHTRTSSPGPAQVSVPLDDVEPPPTVVPKTPTPAQPPARPKTLALSYVINSKIIAKPVPVYPSIARAGGIDGAVAVQILVDESGRVVTARAMSGHPLLQAEAVRAARRARFTPTLLGGHPVAVTGIITYNFVLQ